MKHLPRALASTCLLALAPAAAHAAPVTLQYSVVIDQVCYFVPSLNCPTGPIAGFTLTMTYDDGLLPSSEANPTAGFHEADFGTPTLTMTGGPIVASSNPFGTLTDDLSQLYLRWVDFGPPSDHASSTLVADYSPWHEQWVQASDRSWNYELWYERLSLSRVAVGLPSDGLTTMPTAADLLAELTTGSFTISWSSTIETRWCPETGVCRSPWVQDPRNFFAVGTATPLGPPTPTVPEPASLLLTGLGLIAGGVRLRRRRPHSC